MWGTFIQTISILLLHLIQTIKLTYTPSVSLTKMDGWWMNGWMDRWADGWNDGWKYWWAVCHTDRYFFYPRGNGLCAIFADCQPSLSLEKMCTVDGGAGSQSQKYSIWTLRKLITHSPRVNNTILGLSVQRMFGCDSHQKMGDRVTWESKNNSTLHY